jgi:hypothetical protein
MQQTTEFSVNAHNGRAGRLVDREREKSLDSADP